ncbi:MAG: hypothetical protein WCD86_13415 [Ktedonobacteraceae bacterium]
MSANVGLYSSHDITEEELAQVILQSDGILTPQPEARAFGGIIDGSTYVWINRIPCYDGVFDWEGKPLNEDDITLLDEAKRLLGGEFQTWLFIALNTTPTLAKSGSQRLAVRFAYTCCQRWPCVVDNNEGQLFSCKQIERLYKEGGEFI